MNKLEKATHISLIIACVVAVVFMYDARRTRIAYDAAHTRPMKITRSASLVGTKMMLSGVEWGRAPLNVVVVLSPNCQFCVASLPLYRRLSATRPEAGPRTSITAVSADSSEITQDWLKREKVMVDRVLHVPLNEIGVHRTPTVLLVDAEGTVKKTYEGKLTAPNEEDLLSYVRKSTGM